MSACAEIRSAIIHRMKSGAGTALLAINLSDSERESAYWMVCVCVYSVGFLPKTSEYIYLNRSVCQNMHIARSNGCGSCFCIDEGGQLFPG